MIYRDATATIFRDFGSAPKFRDMCVRVIDYLSTQPSQNLQHISFAALQAVSAAESLEELTVVIRYLTGASVPALDLRFEFIDGSLVEPLAPEAVSVARAENAFFHPETGEVVSDFESKIFMHFAVSKEGEELGETR
jgi:hypothetical protein